MILIDYPLRCPQYSATNQAFLSQFGLRPAILRQIRRFCRSLGCGQDISWEFHRPKQYKTKLPEAIKTSGSSYHFDRAAISFPKYKWGLFGVTTGTPYSDWQIRKTTITDADGRSRSEFKDHAGRLLGTSIGNDAPTYYIYDDNDQLRAVAGSGISLSDTLNMWRYSYDALGRLSSKGIPGSIRESYAYDDEDRIVSITRDGVIKEMEYDDFGRVTSIYLTDDEHTDELIEYHCYDSYPDHDICGSFADYANGWNGPTKNLETLSVFIQIDESGDIDPSRYAMTLHLYDSKARPVRHITDYSGAGILEENITYNFAGDVVNDVFIYTQGGQSDTLKISSAYDIRGRKAGGTSSLTSPWYNSASASTSYSYDTLGRPSGNTITSGSNVISSADTYTLQGWLVNHSVQLNGNVQFSETLSYDTGSSASHTGLIVRKQESQRNGSVPVLYTGNYSYDYAGRLSLENTGELFPPRGKNFNYDARGNLSYVINYTSNISQTPTQNYHYDGDRLVSMDDVSLGHVLSSCSFTHDNLGRMTYDGLSDLQIEYNHLDLPRKVISDGTALVNYSYLADGTKTSSLKPTGEGLVYRGPFVYWRSADGALTLESAACPEGRLTPGKALLYVTDHLGSVRYVIDGNTGAQLEISDYTAYGTRSGSTPSAGTGLTFRDHFTGQEDQMPDFNVPYSDHGARHYNPALLRWMVPDPLSEKYYGQSPYNYCGGNPMSFVDLDGEDWYEAEINGEKRYFYTKHTSQEQLDKAEISGRYLGEAVVVFEGRNDETLGEDKTITGKGAKSAQVTIYGKNGEDDIKTYNGMTTPCDKSKYNTLSEGEYSAIYQDMPSSCYGTSGARSNSAPALTYFIENTYGKTPSGKQTKMTGVYLHRTNWNGQAGNASHGCLVIDGRQWRSVERQLGKSLKIHISLIRK